MKSKKDFIFSLRSHLGIEHGTSRKEGRAPTNSTNPCKTEVVTMAVYESKGVRQSLHWHYRYSPLTWLDK